MSLLLTGCGNNNNLTDTTQHSNEKASTGTMGSSDKLTTSDSLDYSQYVKKIWQNRNATSEVSFAFSKIENGKVTGKLNLLNNLQTDSKLPSIEVDFEGTIDKDTAECQYFDSQGNKGTLEFILKSKNKIDATIKIIDKSKKTVQPPEGTFEFAPENIKDIKGFSPIESQSFMVNLNSWGNVKFVAGKLTGGNHVPVEFYLTNKDGDILYDFAATLPYRVDVKAVSFNDVNKDGLKDIIIIVADEDDHSNCLATVYIQNTDGSFNNNLKLDQEINESGSNKDIQTVTNFLARKF